MALKWLKYLTIGVWLFLIFYSPTLLEYEKNIYFYIFGFIIALIGVFLIEFLFDKNSIKKE